MRKTKVAALVAAACLMTVCAPAQTVIDLGPGGGVRSKGLHDFDRQLKTPRQLVEDSLAYRDCITRAYNALAADSLAQADGLFREALKLMPAQSANPLVYYQLGLIASVRGDDRAVVTEMSHALDARPDMADARRQRAYAYLNLRQLGEARRDCDVLLDGQPADTTALFLRAAVATQQRDYPSAARDLQALLKVSPQHVNGRLSLAIVTQKMGRPREALNALNLLVQSAPGNADCLAARADVEVELGMDEAARADLDAALRLTPDDAGLLLQRAAVLTRLGSRAAARRDLDRAVGLGVPRASLNAQYHALTR